MRIGIESSRYNTNINFFEESINVCVCLSCFSKLFILNERTDNIEDVPKHVGPNLVFADQRGRPARLAKHPAFGLLLSPADNPGQT